MPQPLRGLGKKRRKRRGKRRRKVPTRRRKAKAVRSKRTRKRARPGRRLAPRPPNLVTAQHNQRGQSTL